MARKNQPAETTSRPAPSVTGDGSLPIGDGTPKSPSYEERQAAELAKQREASEKLARVRRLERGEKA